LRETCLLADVERQRHQLVVGGVELGNAIHLLHVAWQQAEPQARDIQLPRGDGITQSCLQGGASRGLFSRARVLLAGLFSRAHVLVVGLICGMFWLWGSFAVCSGCRTLLRHLQLQDVLLGRRDRLLRHPLDLKIFHHVEHHELGQFDQRQRQLWYAVSC